MRFIKPDNIAGEICTLIKEADEKLVIISPYCNFKGWSKLENAFQVAQSKNIDFEFYIRKGESKTAKEVSRLNISHQEIENLHAKIYFNENEALVTSMNLVFYSDQNSLDFAYATTTEAEYAEIVGFYTRHILTQKVLMSDTILAKEDYFTWQDDLEIEISKSCLSNFKITSDDYYELTIQGPNRYKVYINDDGGRNLLKIHGILSKKQFDKLSKNDKLWTKNIPYKLNTASKASGNYNTIWFHGADNLQTKDIYSIVESEAKSIIDQISDFIYCVESLKSNTSKVS